METRFTDPRPLGRGGQGNVVAVRDLARGGEIVALKETWLDDASELRHEFSLLARLTHPHLVRVYDWFAVSPLAPAGGRAPAAYTQQCVPGVGLTRALAGQPLGTREAVFEQVMRALAYLHALQIVHLDLKPDNVLVGEGPSGFEARVLDFGLALPKAERTGSVRGSWSYLAPERFEGGAFDQRSDLYALGIMMIETWIGAPPDPKRMLLELADPDARRAWLAGEGLPPSWVSLCTALTARNPAERLADISEAARRWGRDRGTAVLLHTPGVVAAMLRAARPAGRDPELEHLAEVTSAGGVAVVVGAPGSGRRTLCRAAEHAAQVRGHPTERWPLTESLASWEGLGAALARLVGSAARSILAPLAAVPPDPDPDRYRAALTVAAAEAARALGEELEPARPAPLLVVLGLDDLPLRGRLLCLALVARAEAGGRLPLGLLCTARSHPGSSARTLGPLGRAAVEQFLAQHLGQVGRGAGGDELAARLASASGGQPWLLQQLLGVLVARRELSFEAGAWRWHGAVAGLPLPEGAEAAIAERVGLTTPLARDVLGAVAWLRYGARVAEVDAVLGGEGSAGPELEELEAAGLVWCDPQQSYRIAHAALGEPLLGFEPSGGAEAAHRRVLARAAPAGMARAWHLGGEEGAQEATALGSAREAQGSLERAAEAFDLALELWPGQRAALCGRARVANLLGPRARQIACLEALVAQSTGEERLGYERQRFWALTRVGDSQRAELAGRELCALARELGEEAVLAEALVDLATTRVQRGDYAEGEALLSEARRLAERLRTPGLEARIFNNLGNIHAYRGDHGAALEEYARARALKAAEGDPVGERIALGNMGLMCLELGRSAEALSHFAASLAAARATGHRRGVAWSLVALAVLSLEGGALARARRRAEQALAVADELGDQVIALDALGTLAEIALAEGRAPEAEALAERAWAGAGACGSAYNAAGARATLAAAVQDAARARELAEAVAGDASASAKARGAALGVLLEAQVRRGDLAQARGTMDGALALGARNLPLRALASAVRVAGMLVGGRALAGKLRAEVALRREAWPVEPVDDGGDAGEAEGVETWDGPCRATFGAIPAVREMLEGGLEMAESTRAQAADGARASSRGATHGWLAVAGGAEGALPKAIAVEIAALVAAAGAERGFLVDARGSVVCARDADGDAVPGAERKAPLPAAEEARRAGGAWVAGAEGIGAWVVPTPPGEAPGPVCLLQNRFSPGVIERMTDSPPDLGPLAVLLRVERLVGDVDRLERELETAREKARSSETRSTEELIRLRRELETSREQLGPLLSYPEIVFASPAMKRMLRRVDKLVGADLPVYIHGESGTGKELVARAIHHHGPRKAGPFVAQNCSAIPHTLFESEFFGHERGAFTGAERATEGLFRRADRGTLFLDEIGDLPLDLQAKLLRVLETHEVRPVGSSKGHQVDVRIICATHRDLEDLARKGSFRQDLYYRLHGVRVVVPPLRERIEDVPVLVEHFLAIAARGGPQRALAKGVMKALCAYAWPGNVRQLENEIARAAILCDGEIRLADLSDEVRSGGSGGLAGADATLARRLCGGPGTLQARVDRLERAVLQEALTEHRGNKSRVARELGLSRAGLLMKLKRLGILEAAAE